MNKKVLLICYYFPPLGLGGVGRPLNLFKKLPDHGWDCHILTVKPVAYRAYEPELLDGLDTSGIFRSGSIDPQRLLYLLGVRTVKAKAISKSRRVAEKFFPDSKVGWVKPAVRLGRRLCKKYNYDAIISTSPPVSSHLVALGLKDEFGSAWIADFRDFWTTYKVEETFSDPQQVTRGQQLLSRITTEASAATAVNATIAAYLGRAEVITNGYDSDLAEYWAGSPDRDAFTIGLLGHQHDIYEVGPLLELLAGLRDAYPSKFAETRLLQVGQIDAAWFKRLLAEHNLKLTVEISGRLPRDATIRTLSRAHLHFLGVSSSGGDHFLPGRTFDLLASGRPIIAYTPADSEVGRLLAPLDRACCIDHTDVAGALEFLVKQIEAFENGLYSFEPLPEDARRLSSDVLAQKFASLMDNLT